MKNILICVSGLTPQIITETLYCLSKQKKIKVDELYIITTSRGRDIIYGIDTEYNKNRKYPALNTEITNMCSKYKIIPPKFALNHKHIITALEQSLEISDIRNDIHNKLFPNKVCEFISSKTADRNNILHCSVSGGRKTMSVDIAFALTIFGREYDKLYHVLTKDKFEFKGFYPANKAEEKALVLSEIPFIKIRPLISEITLDKGLNEYTYTKIVELSQKILKQKSAPKLKINSTTRFIQFGENKPVRLAPVEFSIYYYILNQKRSGFNSVQMDDLSFFMGANITNLSIYQKRNLTNINKLNKKIEMAINDIDNIGPFRLWGPDEYGQGRYGIPAETTSFELTS